VPAAIIDAQEVDRHPELAAFPPVVPDDVAYLLFTSGSTGRPKGVPVTHGNVLHFLDAAQARYGITSEDRLTQTFDQTFDLSVFDLFMAWSNGATLCAFSPVDLLAPIGFVNKLGITVWFSVPSVAAQMRKRKTLNPGSMPTLRWSLFCGEALPRESAKAWQLAAPNSIVENLYGPTELTIACFVHRWDSLSSPGMCVNELVPIGRPLPGLVALVFGDDGRPAPLGTAGELCVSGPQTTPGYWRDVDKTTEKYQHLDVAVNDSRRFYRTGDRVMKTENEEYVFFGRIDNQVKILGHRVELGEVEAALQRYPGVIEVAALPWPFIEGAAIGLVAFVTGTQIDPEGMKGAASQVLPAYSVPHTIHVRSSMPLNANGKIDRKALVALLDAGTPLGEAVSREAAAIS
jgi:amino acid adenylation domain-containing protein